MTVVGVTVASVTVASVTVASVTVTGLTVTGLTVTGLTVAGVTVVIRPVEQMSQLEGGSGEQPNGGGAKKQMDKAVSKTLLLIAQFFGLQARNF